MSYAQPNAQPNAQPYAQPSEQPSSGSAPLERILIAHVVCGAAATLFILPFGVLIPRYARALSAGRWWFPVHMILQLAGIVLALVALGTGFTMGGNGNNTHPNLGIVLAVGLGLQVLLGIFVHWYKGKFNRPVVNSGRGYIHFVHVGLGLIVIIIGWATALTGFLQQWSGEEGAGEGFFMLGWRIIFGVAIGVFGLAYLIGVFALPKRRALPDSNIESPGTLHGLEDMTERDRRRDIVGNDKYEK